MLYCDECAYMALSVFYKVVLPILEVLYTVLIMISTLVDAWNFFSRILETAMQQMREGRPQIVAFQQKLICDRCMAQKEGDTNCTHCDDDVPPWKRGATRDLVRIIMGDGQEDVFKRESMGVVAGALNTVWHIDSVRPLLTNPWYDRSEEVGPQHLYVAFDPNGGGLSHSAITAIARMGSGKGQRVICGMDSMQTTNTTQMKEFIYWFIQGLRADPWLCDAHIIYACENNGITFGVMEEVMAGVPNSSTVYEKPTGKPGIETNGRKKNAYAIYMRQELSRGSFSFLRDFVTCHSMPLGGKQTAHGMATDETHKRILLRQELFEQAKRARPTQRPYTTDFKPRITGWSAKCNDAGEVVAGMNDDLLLSVCIGVYVLRQYELRSKIFRQVHLNQPGTLEQNETMVESIGTAEMSSLHGYGQQLVHAY